MPVLPTQPHISTDPGWPAAQQARSQITRDRLLVAAADCLAELGYAGTSTTRVCDRAGVSQGALYKHFGHKRRLLAQTTDRLFRDLLDEYEQDVREVDVAGGGIQRALERLWSAFCDARLRAVFELYMAARTDEALKAALVPMLTAHRDRLVAVAIRLFPVAARSNSRFDAIVNVVIDTMQGRALGDLVLPDESAREREFDYLRGLVERELGSGEAGGASSGPPSQAARNEADPRGEERQ